MRTKPRLQPRAFAKSISLSVIPADLKRLAIWMKAQGIATRSEALRRMLDLVGV